MLSVSEIGRIAVASNLFLHSKRQLQAPVKVTFSTESSYRDCFSWTSTSVNVYTRMMTATALTVTISHRVSLTRLA